jgi:hypothetical protein
VLAERTAENALGAAVHRRGVEEARPALPDRVDNLARGALTIRADVEGLPRAQSHDGHVHAGSSESPVLHAPRPTRSGAADARALSS